jgi:hypothetical protein
MSEVTWEYRPFAGPPGDDLQVPDGGPRMRPYKISVTFINRQFFSATITGIGQELPGELHAAIEVLPAEAATHWTVRYTSTNLRELPDWAKPYTLWENLT